MSNKEKYETSLSLNQALTFTKLQQEMSARNMECGSGLKRTLNMIGEDGLYTNLALLLSDQCEHTLKIAVFQGTDDVIIRNHQEFKGSLLTQLEDGYSFLEKNIAVKSSIEGLRRNDVRDYPLAAVREALLNAIIHRDYSFTGSTLIKIYDDRIEFVSLGGLISGLSIDAVTMGVSQSRNSNLSNVFHILKLAENHGTGIKRIRDLYKDCPRQAVFESAAGAFRTTIFNLNFKCNIEKIGYFQQNAELEIVMKFAVNKKVITRREVEKILSVGSTKAYSLLTEMCHKGMLTVKKAGNKTRYFPTLVEE
ncbi:ATP-binding protein [Succinivibrio dextrinosolvens]|uniref:ATP-binding protein n=1 Tax=Succinivibrio dextrinosolvens TaxID=83771 RepID=UPI00068E0291|nr:ATP-binding protein [Succinivibrio dextrinosolvens]